MSTHEPQDEPGLARFAVKALLGILTLALAFGAGVVFGLRSIQP